MLNFTLVSILQDIRMIPPHTHRLSQYTLVASSDFQYKEL